MDAENLRNMYRICGGNYAGKLHLLMDYTDRPGDVADPWYTRDFDMITPRIQQNSLNSTTHFQLLQ